MRLPKRMNFFKSSKKGGQGGHFRSQKYIVYFPCLQICSIVLSLSLSCPLQCHSRVMRFQPRSLKMGLWLCLLPCWMYWLYTIHITIMQIQEMIFAKMHSKNSEDYAFNQMMIYFDILKAHKQMEATRVTVEVSVFKLICEIVANIFGLDCM